MARRRRGRGSRRRRSGGRRRGGIKGIFSMFGMIKSWKFWATLGVMVTLMFAFWQTPLGWFQTAAEKVKGMINKSKTA